MVDSTRPVGSPKRIEGAAPAPLSPPSVPTPNGAIANGSAFNSASAPVLRNITAANPRVVGGVLGTVLPLPLSVAGNKALDGIAGLSGPLTPEVRPGIIASITEAIS